MSASAITALHPAETSSPPLLIDITDTALEAYERALDIDLGESTIDYLLTLQLVQNTEEVNSRLQDLGREDLAIRAVAPMAPFDPLTVENFSRRGLHTLTLLMGEQGYKLETLINLKIMNKSVIESVEVIKANGYDWSTASQIVQSVLSKGAFSRLWALNPGLTTQLVWDYYLRGEGLSPEAQLEARTYSPELRALYTLVSHLVDMNDTGAVTEATYPNVDSEYLCR